MSTTLRGNAWLRRRSLSLKSARPRGGDAGEEACCNHEGVEVGAHISLQVDGALATPTFDTLAPGRYTPDTAAAVNYRSSI